MDVELDILKKLPPDNTVDYSFLGGLAPLQIGGDNMRSFETGEAPAENKFVDPLTLTKFSKPYIKNAFELEDPIAELFRKAAEADCYRCNGRGIQWRARGWVATRCKCVKVLA